MIIKTVATCEGDEIMWVLKYVACLVKHHNWVGSRVQYCLRCGKLEMGIKSALDSLSGEGSVNNPEAVIAE
jgi:hypothetical protein